MLLSIVWENIRSTYFHKERAQIDEKKKKQQQAHIFLAHS